MTLSWSSISPAEKVVTVVDVFSAMRDVIAAVVRHIAPVVGEDLVGSRVRDVHGRAVRRDPFLVAVAAGEACAELLGGCGIAPAAEQRKGYYDQG